MDTFFPPGTPLSSLMVEPEPVGYMYDYGTSSQMQSQESINMDKLFICMAVQLRSQSLSKALHTAASHSE